MQLKSVFSPSWSVCLDESMMMWEKPGWVIVCICDYKKKRYWPRHIDGDAIRAGAASLELYAFAIIF